MSGIVKTLRTGEKLSAKALFSCHPLIYTTQKEANKKASNRRKHFTHHFIQSITE